ncbi:hypothetical protein J6590_054146 [Homalodisca vitripennis]|nr:hypothetical protein J6590_054146 [Homalodisca vitripennis]
MMILYNRIKDQLDKELGEYQGGFRPWRSCTEQIITLNNLRMKNAVEKTVVVRPQIHTRGSEEFHCDPKEIFIIVGTRQGLWLDLAEWLLKNGAKKLVIASLKQNLTSNISRRFNSMLALHRATVLITTIARLDSQKEVVDFLQEAIRMGPVAGIFFSCMDEKSSVVAHLDSASRQLLPQLKHFVCLFGGSASVCELRAQSDLPACVIRTQSDLKPQSVLPYLGRILGQGKSMGYSLLLSDGETNYKQRGQTVPLLDIRNHLPTSLPQLVALGQIMSSEEHFQMQEVITRSPPYEHVRYQLLPVFLVPGLDCDRLTPLIRQLMHPAFCPLTPPCLPSIEQSAQLLLQSPTTVRILSSLKAVRHVSSGPSPFRALIVLFCRTSTLWRFEIVVPPQAIRPYLKVYCNVCEMTYEERDQKNGRVAFFYIATMCPCHTSLLTSFWLKSVSVCPHPPSSPDVAPWDFWLFPKIKTEILQVKSSGPYNLLGDSWSGTMVLQLAILLQRHGLVEVFLLDAAPDTAKQRFAAFSNSSDTFKDSEFLITLFNLPTNISNHLSEVSSWEEQVQYCLSQVQMEVSNDCSTSLKYVTKALMMLRNHLKALTTFQPSEQFEGNVHLFRTREALESDFCGLKKLSINPNFLDTCNQQSYSLIDYENAQTTTKLPIQQLSTSRLLIHNYECDRAKCGVAALHSATHSEVPN